LFIDPRSAATRPAALAVAWGTYFRRHPGWTLPLVGAIGLAILTWKLRSPLAGGLALAGVGIFFFHVVYVRMRSAGGMLCPARTISERPFLVAVLTDLAATDSSSHPVLKVFAPPAALACAVGTPLAAVVLYSGQTPAGHWDNCQPTLALSANDDRAVQQGLLERISSEEWERLAQACQQLILPPRCGLFQLKRARARDLSL